VIEFLDDNYAHCGYELPWWYMKLLPFNTGSHYHDHHHTKNTGNFCGLTTIWDSVCGTNTKYYENKFKKQEMIKEKED